MDTHTMTDTHTTPATTTTTIIAIPQINRGTRYIAASTADARRCADDPALIDTIKVLGSIDVYHNAPTEYGPVGPLWRNVPNYVRAALRAAVRDAADE